MQEVTPVRPHSGQQSFYFVKWLRSLVWKFAFGPWMDEGCEESKVKLGTVWEV